MMMKVENSASTAVMSTVDKTATSLMECMELYGKTDHIKGDRCNAVWDNFYCWPSTPAGDVITRSCTEIFPFLSIPIGEQKDFYAYRICSSSGEWMWGNWTNYTECLSLAQQETPPIPLVVSHILLICSSVSVVFLLTALFVFFYFRSLQCTRLRVHRNLVGSLIAHSLLLVLISLPAINSPNIPSYQNIEWLCKTVLALKMYTSMASINWMFLEGLLLHSRITTSIFRQDAPFKIYYFIGWGIPLMLILGWTFAMETTLLTPCWKTYGHSVFIWIVTGPMITALTINFVFLVNIIRILVTKLKTSLALEITQVRKAIKATALLFPLLGITHLLFCVNPQDDGSLQDAYMITNAVLQSSQGIFVTILYCFLNSDVQLALRKAYLRQALRRNPNRRYTWVRKGPGSQYSTASITHCDVSTANAASSTGQKSLILLKNGRSNDSTKSSCVEVKLCNDSRNGTKYTQDNL